MSERDRRQGSRLEARTRLLRRGTSVGDDDVRWDAEVQPLWTTDDAGVGDWLLSSPFDPEVKKLFSANTESFGNGSAMLTTVQWPEADHPQLQQPLAGTKVAISAVIDVASSMSPASGAAAPSPACRAAVQPLALDSSLPHFDAFCQLQNSRRPSLDNSLGSASLATASNGYDSDSSSAASLPPPFATCAAPAVSLQSSTAGAFFLPRPQSLLPHLLTEQSGTAPSIKAQSSCASSPTPTAGDPSFLTVYRPSSSLGSAYSSASMLSLTRSSSRKPQLQAALSGTAAGASNSSSSLGGASQSGATTSAAAVAAEQRRLDLPSRDRRRIWFAGSYKQRSEEFKRIFKDVPTEERLLFDYSCAMQKDLLQHGRLYVSQNWICFYANIFKWETTVAIPFREVAAITKEKSAKFIPALHITTAKDRLVLTSFVSRDKSYLMIFKAWQHSTTGQVLTSQELNMWISHFYGWSPDIASSDMEDIDALSAGAGTEVLVSDASAMDRSDSQTKDELTQVEAQRKDAAMSISCSVDGIEQLCRGSLAAPSAAAVLVHSASSGAALSSSAATASCVNGGLACLSREVAASEPSLLRPGVGSGSRTSHLQNDAAASTDGSDTTEDEDVEVMSADPRNNTAVSIATSCAWHKHTGQLMIDDEYEISAKELFGILFSDSDFMRRFLDSRKTTDVVITPWPDETDGNGNKQRTNTYTIALNAPIGPKSTPATEIQIMYKECVADTYYCVDCKCMNSPDLPYGENFYVLNKYCILGLGKGCSRLIVHSEIVYVKSVFVVVRGFIQKNVNNGVSSYFEPLKQSLREECDRRRRVATPSMRTASKLTIRRRSRRTGSPPSDIPCSSSATSSPVNAPARKISVPTAGRSAYTIASPEASQPATSASIPGSRHTELLTFAILVFLIAFNAFLYYKLCLLESTVLSSEPSPYAQIPSHSSGQCRLTSSELLLSLQQQREVHIREVEQWRHQLEASGKYIDELKSTVEELKASVRRLHGAGSMESST